MTIPYSFRVSTARGIGNFYKVLPVWHGSVYKMIWRDFIIYSICYGIISVFYRYFLVDNHPEFAKTFDKLVFYFRANNSRIPIVFVLSFFVAIVNERWWAQVMLIPWPDPICLQISVLVRGQDKRGRLIRRALARYINLSLIFGFELMSEDVRLRFPTLESFCTAGLLLPHEMAILQHLKKSINYPIYYVPIVWAANLIYRAQKEGRIVDDISTRNIIIRLQRFRTQLLELLNYSVVQIPLAYTQVSTIAVYVYFIVALIGNQFVHDAKDIDVYIPIFGFLEFFFFVGWLKIAEAMLNPYGDDDDDFELNWIIDRNIQVSYLLVDEIHRAVPTNLRSQYYETVLRKPFYVAKRRKDGTYSNEVRPRKELQKKEKEGGGVESFETKEKETSPHDSDAEGLFELYTVDDDDLAIESMMKFEDMLTQAPKAPTPPDSDDETSDDLQRSTQSSAASIHARQRRRSSIASSDINTDRRRSSIASSDSQTARRMSTASDDSAKVEKQKSSLIEGIKLRRESSISSKASQQSQQRRDKLE